MSTESDLNFDLQDVNEAVSTQEDSLKINPIKEEDEFQEWLNTNPDVLAWKKQYKEQYGEDPDIESSNYDYRGAWKAGVTPKPNEDHNGMYHWGSIGVDGKNLKSENHPTRWKSDFMEATGMDPDKTGISEKVEKYTQLFPGDQEEIDSYIQMLIEDNSLVKASQLDEEETEPLTWAQEYSSDKKNEMLSAVDRTLGIKDNDYTTINYQHSQWGPFNDIDINDDNVDEWLNGESKRTDEYVDNIIQEQLSSQLADYFTEQMEQQGYLKKIWTDEDKKELIEAVREDYKYNFKNKRREFAYDQNFEQVFNAAMQNKTQTDFSTYGKNYKTGLPNQPRLGGTVVGNDYDSEEQYEQRNTSVVYNQIFDETLESSLKKLSVENPNLKDIYDLNIEAENLYKEFQKDQNPTTKDDYTSAVAKLNNLRDSVGFGKFLYTPGGDLIEGVTQEQADALSQESQGEFEMLEYMYSMDNPDEAHTLKNRWLKTNLYVDALEKKAEELASKELEFRSQETLNEYGNVGRSSTTPFSKELYKARQELLKAKAQQEAVNHYYLLNHRYLTGEKANDTYKAEKFVQGFVQGFGVSSFDAAAMFGTPEHTEAAALNILNDFGINVTDEEIDAVGTSTGEDFSLAMGDMTSLIAKLYGTKKIANPIFLGGGYVQASLGGLATIDRLKKYPKVISKLNKIGKNGLIGSYYKKRVDAAGNLLKGLSFREKMSMVVIGGTMEEVAFQTVGGHAGHGFGFGASKFIPLKLFGKWQPKNMYSRLFKRNVIGNLNRSASATLAMEAAGVTGAFYEIARYDDTFKEKFNELFPGINEVGERLLFNLALNSTLGLSEAYNPASISNLLRSTASNASSLRLVRDRVKQDFVTKKTDLIKAINYLSADPIWGGKGKETNKEAIESFKEDLEYAYNFELNFNNYINNRIVEDLNTTSAGAKTDAIQSHMDAAVEAMTYRVGEWQGQAQKHIERINKLNKEVYGAQSYTLTEKDFEHVKAQNLGLADVAKFLYDKQINQEVARAKYLQRYNIIREVPFIDKQTQEEKDISFRITKNKTAGGNRLDEYTHVEGQTVLKGYFARKAADGNTYKLTAGQRNKLSDADKKEAKKIFDAEVNNLNNKNPKFIGDGTTTGGTLNRVEIGKNTVDKQISIEESKSSVTRNKKLITSLKIAKKLLNILPEGVQAKFIFHTDAKSLSAVIKARAAEKRSNIISKFNQGRSINDGVKGYSEQNFRNDLRTIEIDALKQTKNAFIVGKDNMIHVDVSHDSNIKAKDLPNILAHEFAHPLLEMIKQIDPKAYKALEKLMRKDSKYQQKLEWATKNYLNPGLSVKNYSSHEEFVEAAKQNQSLILNETMAEWLGHSIAKSELSTDFTRGLRTALNHVIGEPISMLFRETNTDPRKITIGDISDLSSFAKKINKAIRVGNRMRLDPELELPVFEGNASTEQFNLIGEDAIVKYGKDKADVYDKLMQARAMRRDGASAWEIYKDTEFFLNNSGKLMKFEGTGYLNGPAINNLVDRIFKSGDPTKSGVQATLGEIFEGPYKLYYPEIGNAIVKFVPKEPSSPKLGSITEALESEKGIGGEPFKPYMTVYIPKDRMGSKEDLYKFLTEQKYSSASTSERMLEIYGSRGGSTPVSTIIHETQHLIQLAESGMGFGSSPGRTAQKFRGLYLDKNFANRVNSKFVNIRKTREEIYALEKELKGKGGFSNGQKEIIDQEHRELVKKQSDLRWLMAWNARQEVKFNQIFKSVAFAESIAIEKLLGSGKVDKMLTQKEIELLKSKMPKLARPGQKPPKELLDLFNDLNRSVTSRYFEYSKKAKAGTLTQKEMDEINNRYIIIKQLLDPRASYLKSHGETVARMAQVFSKIDAELLKSPDVETERFLKSTVIALGETHADIADGGYQKGYLNNALDYVNGKAPHVPFGKEYEKSGGNVTAAPANSELFIAREKVKTPDTYIEYLEKFSKKKTFISKTGGPQGLGKIYDDKTADKLKAMGDIAKALREYDGDVMSDAMDKMEFWRTEAIKFIDFKSTLGGSADVAKERSGAHSEFLKLNKDVSDIDWENEIQNWINVYKLIDFSSESFQQGQWESHFKYVKKLETKGKDTFTENIQNGNDFRTGTNEQAENIQMIMDILEGDGGQKGKRSYLTRLFGGTKSRDLNSNRWSVRQLNLYGTHNIYSLLEDLSINHSESETFKSPMVQFALTRMSKAETDYFTNKYAVLDVINTRMREIYGIEPPKEGASQRTIKQYQKKVTNIFRENERKNKIKQNVLYTDKNGEDQIAPDKWTANEAAKLYIETMDVTNHKALEAMGIMERTFSLQERYKDFEAFEKSTDYPTLEIKMVGQGFEGYRTRTVEQAQNKINEINRLKLEAIQKEVADKVISTKAGRAKTKIQASAHEKALMNIRKQAKQSYDSDASGQYKLTSYGNNIIGLVDANLKEWSNFVVDEFFPAYSNGQLYEGHTNLDAVFRGVYGFALPTNKKYSPVMRKLESDQVNGGIDLLTAERFYQEMSSSHFKEKGSSSQALAKQDINNMLLRFVHKMEFFKAYQKPLTDLNNVFNNELVKDKITQDFGPEYHKYLNMNIRELAGKDKQMSAFMELLQKARTNYVIGSLGAKPSLTIKQLTSFVAYAADMPVADFGKGLADLATVGDVSKGEAVFPEFKKAYETLMDLDYMKKRYARLQFDDALAQVMSPAEFERVPSKAAYAKKRFTNALMSPVVLGDKYAIIIGGWPKYKYHYKKALSEGKTEQEARAIAEKEFEASTRFAQQASESSDLSAGQRDPVGKMFAMYATSPMSYYRQARAAVRAQTAGKGTSPSNYKKLFIYHVLLPQLFQGATNSFNLARKSLIMGESIEDDLQVEGWGEFIANPSWENWEAIETGGVAKSHIRAGAVGSFNGIFILKDIIMAFANEYIEDKNYPYRAMPIESAVEAIVRNSSAFKTHIVELMSAGEEIGPDDLLDAALLFGKTAEGIGTLGFGLPMVGAKKALEPLLAPLTEEDAGFDPNIDYKYPRPN